jgi:CubicO group peptidase (beta-lactamase class C family)
MLALTKIVTLKIHSPLFGNNLLELNPLYMKATKTTSLILILALALIQSCNQNKGNQTLTQESGVKLLDSLFNTAVTKSEIPGAVVYLAHNGKNVFNKAYGFRNIRNKVPMQNNDIFRMASMTKALTAVALLQLYERGLLFLDDKVSKYIPEFKNPRVLIDVLPDSSFTSKPAAGEITLRQLLTHTSGIGYGFQDERYNALVIKNKISEGFEDDDRTSLENIRRIAGLPLLFEPGEKYTYGLSYDVLGVVIETISGMRYDEYIQKNILVPLGMTDSYFIIPEKEQYRLVTAYQSTGNGNGLEPTTYADTAYPVIKNRRYFSAAADLCSTAEDYGKFIQMVLNKGIYNNTRIISNRAVEMMLSKQASFDDRGSFQGFAAWITNENGAAEGPMALGSFGFGGFWDTYGWADPKNNFVAVLLLQMYPNNQHKIHEKFKAITYGVIDGLN